MMRRARIKVTASVPLRRKVIKVEEPEVISRDPDGIEEELTPEVPRDELKPEILVEEIKVGGAGGTISGGAKAPVEDGSPHLQEKAPEVERDEGEKVPLGAGAEGQKPGETGKTASVVEGFPRRARLFSESSDKGHLSGSEAASPIKVLPNRSFTRPTPRLDGSTRIRRNSIQGSGASASESEDDSRRHPPPPHPPPSSHPSQPSQNSSHPPPPAQNPSQSQTQNPKQKRKVLISESARKLAESRREFFLRHEHKQPDRTKLTMYDLIYYNPATNPMKKTATSLVQDEPEEVTEPEEEEDDSAMPVPQLKVGPNGELVVDEQSLVIENTALKRDREAVSKRRVLVDEEGAIGGFYKKRVKSRDWTHVETLKFYKALNTVGTDFSLMQTVFPSRTRHELKMKYKKEEKLNRALVEKALVYHQEYDIETLRKELESFENVEEKSKKTRKSTDSYRKRIAKKRNVATSVNMLSEDEDDPGDVGDEPEETSKDQETEDREGEGVSRVKRKRPRGKKTVEPDPSEDSLSEDDFEVYKVKPTRSGRLPKRKRPVFNATNVLDDIFDEGGEQAGEDEGEEEARGVELGEPVEGLQDVEPGSLVIVSKESPDEPGKTIVQVYMVGKDLNGGEEKMTPVDLSSELLSTVTSGLNSHGVSPIKFTLK
ncbi:transcription factor TFIIIB component B'' homolog [Diachasma alloeum]|uniref:transcription factor TFIIIB component B'' homolog n=1 Tax=Diachasma alloeum TaxID=454923 RepID=UPI0007383EEA|nr:transcription factor TFIIIB component B'' homolog [Diachasma alloeum]